MAEVMVTFEDLAAADKRVVVLLRRPVAALARVLTQARESVTEIAPRVMRLYRDLEGKHEARLGGFVGFARLIDPTVPMHAADNDEGPGYRNHKTYYTLTYIRRTYTTANRQRGQQGRRDPATDQLARTLATILQVVADAGPVWAALAGEFKMSPRMIARLKARTEAVQPILNLRGLGRPMRVGENLIVHMEPAAAVGAAAPVVAARRGRPRREAAAA